MLTPLRTKIGDLVASVILLRPKSGGGSTTLNANAAAGATALTLSVTTNFTDTDPVLVGAEEDAELVVQTGAPAGAVITVITPGLKRAHVSTEPVKELEAFDLGNVTNVRRGDTADVADNETDVARNPDGRRLGHLTRQASFDLQGYSPWHFAALTGMSLVRVRGAGTQADPTQLHTDGEDFSAEDSAIVLTEKLKDGTFLQHQFDACSADYTGIVIPFGQGRETTMAAKFIAANHGRELLSAPAFAVGTTQQVRKTHQIETLLEAGYFRVLSGGLSTTLTSQTAKDAKVFNLTVATGVAAGKYYLVTGGGKVQVILAHSLATLAMTCRTEAYYTFPTGSTVVELEQVLFGGLKQDSTEFRVGGSMRAVKLDNMRVQVGAVAGSALFTAAFTPVGRILDNLRLQNGLPTAAITGGNVMTESDLAGTDAPMGWWMRAQKKDTKTVQFIGSGVDNGLETLEQMLSKTEVPGTPLTFRAQMVSQLQW